MNQTSKKLIPTGPPHERRHPLQDGGVKITTFVPLQFKKRGLKKVVVGPEGVANPVSVNASAPAITPNQDTFLLKTLGRCYYWQHLLDSGVVANTVEIAAQEGDAAAHAEADDRDRAFFLELVDCGLRVLEHRVPVRVGDELARIGDLVRRIAALEVLLRAIEQRRRDGGIAFGGEPVADRADVMIDAENLLDDDDAAFRRAGWIGPISTKLKAVGRGERELLAQWNLPMFVT